MNVEFYRLFDVGGEVNNPALCREGDGRIWEIIDNSISQDYQKIGNGEQ